MKYAPDFYPESRFGGFTDIDGTVIFFSRVNALLTPASVAVDFGCGAYQDDPVPLRRNPRLRRLLRDHGFAAAVYGYEAEPSYLEFSRLADALGVLHQRLAPRFLRPALFAFSEKLPAPGRP